MHQAWEKKAFIPINFHKGISGEDLEIMGMQYENCCEYVKYVAY